MTSNPPAKCCTVGTIHEGEAKGEIKNIGDTEIYFSYPPDRSTKRAILILSDVIGHRYINIQLIADQLAANGYFVVIPDLFHGDPVQLNRPDDFDIMEWIQGHLPPRVDPVVEMVLKEMRNNYGCEKIGAVGHCFGGKYVVRHLKPSEKKIDVGFVAHPSFVDSEELIAIDGPLSIAAAETDQIFTVPQRHESEEILPKTRQPYEITVFGGTQHGFAVRGDVKDPRVKYAREQAFNQSVNWFNYHL